MQHTYTFSFVSVSAANYYLDGLTWSASTGVLTASVNGTTNQTVDLDGRYSTTDTNTITRLKEGGSGSFVSGDITFTGGGATTVTQTGSTFAISTTVSGYTLPLATSSARGGVKIGYAENNKNYPVELSSEKMFVNVPWTDTVSGDTTYTAGTGLDLNGTEFTHSDTSSYAGTSASSRTYITGIAVDTYGHITSVTTGTETVTDTNDNYYLSSLAWDSATGVLTANRSGLTALTIDLDGRYSQGANYGFTEIRGYNSNVGSGYASQTTASAASGIMFFSAGSNITFSETTNFGGTGKDAMVITAANDNTTYSAGTNMSLSGTTFSATDTNTTYSAGTGMSLSGTTFNCDVVNTDTNTTYTAGNGLTLSGTQFLMSGNYTGTFTASADVVAYSDKKLKDNVETLDGSKVFDMRGVSFNRNDQDGKLSSGVIAQELEMIAPELIHESEDGTKGVAYGNTVGYLIEAIKLLKAEVDDLKKQLNEK